MAKIIYGVSGQGFGHAARSKETLKYLISQGHEVLVFTYGQALFFLEKDFNVYEVHGLKLGYRKNHVSYFKTFYKNVLQFIKKSKNWKKTLNIFRDFNPDIVITDFEAITAFLAKLQRVPMISLDNQHQLTNTKIILPSRYQKDLLTDKLIIRSVVWGANYYLITSFFETKVKKKNTFLFSPVLRREVTDLQPSRGDYILVYQTSNFKKIVRKLKKLDYRFFVVGMDKEATDGNIEYKKASHDQWLKLLAGCRAVVGNAGASLMAECLYLRKPYLAVPVKRQAEQIVNAVYLEKLGYGAFCRKFNYQAIYKFLEKLPEFEKNIKRYKKKSNVAIMRKLDNIIKEFTPH